MSTPGESLDHSNAIDVICDQFEQRCLAGEQLRIEDWLADNTESFRGHLLSELLLVELEVRRQAGETPTAADYAPRFPDQTAVIEDAFDTIAKRANSPALSETVDFSLSPADETYVRGNRADTETIAPAFGTPPEQEPVAKPSGKLFGDYEILEEIARGGMGIVFRARQTKLNRIVALKMIKSGELAGEDEVQRFQTEAEAAAQLDHPHIVPIYEVGERHGQHFFSMGLVDGEGLDTRLKAGPLAPGTAAELIASIAEAVHFAHEKGIMHRDLKPANVLLDADGKPRITDFGLAKNTTADSGMTATGQVMGTPSYMPPEQAAGKTEEIGPLADVYSLGAMLYALLTGRPPFQAASVMDTLKQVLEQEPLPPRKLNPAIPRDLETICLKCLRKESSGRYSTAQALGDDLRRWLENKPIVARRIGPVRKGWLWCKRKPALAGSLAALLLVVTAGSLIARGIIRDRDRQAAEENNATTASGLVDSLVNADIAQVPAIVREIDGYREWADPLLKQKLADAKEGSPEKLRLSLALLPVDREQVSNLQTALLNADAPSLPVIRDALQPYKADITPTLWKVLASTDESLPRRFNAACALATYDGDNVMAWQPVLPFVADRLVETLTRSPRDFAVVLKSLEPIRKRLAEPVAAIVRDAKRGELQRETALNVVLEYAGDDSRQLSEVLAYSEQRQFGKTFDKLAAQKTAALPHLAAILEETWKDETPESEKERIAQRQANAAVALLRLRESEPVWPLLKHRPDPRARSNLIHWAALLDVDPQLFLNRFETESDTSIRRGLLLTLGEFDERQLPATLRAPLAKQLLAIYESDPDPGVHGCAEWLLRKWHHDKGIREITKKLQANEEQRQAQMKNDERRWYVTTQGQTFAVLKADVFRMGSPDSEPERDLDETRHQRKIGRTFAIAMHEVTREQYQRFQKENPTIRRFKIDQYSWTADSPHVGVNWYEATAYCNWLSKKEKIPEDQWCYEKNKQGKYAAGMKAKKNYLQLTGYRLPTEAEWEYACRAGATTSRYFGLTETLLPRYARYTANSEKHVWPAGGQKPNGFGLFDMLGNVREWCHDGSNSYPAVDPKQPVPENVDNRPVSDAQYRLLRGGSFNFQPSYVRCAGRDVYRPSYRSVSNGFRPSRTYP